jgi:hypothetical protein
MTGQQREFIALCDPEMRLPLTAGNRLSHISPQELCLRACFHGVHHFLLANMQAPGRTVGYPTTWVVTSGELLTEVVRKDAARTLHLRTEGQRILRTLRSAGIEVLLLKGADFADHLYPLPGLRSSTDIDLLVREREFGRAGDMLVSLGCRQEAEHGRKHAAPYGEELFILDTAGVTVRVELHWNMVNSPSLRRAVTLSYDDLVMEDGGLENEGRLLIAAVHGGTGHQFDRLKFLVDLLQLFRRSGGKFDATWLKERVRRTGSERVLSMACWLVQTMFGEALPQSLLAELALPSPSPLLCWLLSPGVLLAMEPGRTDKLRKMIFRHSLKRRGVT